MTDTKLAELLAITPRAVLDMKKKTPLRYELLRTGAKIKDKRTLNSRNSRIMLCNLTLKALKTTVCLLQSRNNYLKYLRNSSI